MNEINQYVEEHIQEFHDARIARIKSMKLKDLLKRKNPYLFKAKNAQTAEEIVRMLIDAYLSSQEETLLGTFLEGLAIFVCAKSFGGQKSSTTGIDLEFNREEIRYLVSIKSGPNWGNSSQIKKMIEDFKKAKITLRTNYKGMNIQAVNGCCYGKSDKTDKGDYFKYCGQRFWEFVSGDKYLYRTIIEPLGIRAKEKNGSFQLEYSRIVNQFTQKFMKDFLKDGLIDWDKLLIFNSGDKIMEAQS